MRRVALSWLLIVPLMSQVGSAGEQVPQPTTEREADFGAVIQGEVVKQSFSIQGVPPGSAIARVEVNQPGVAARFRRAPEPESQPLVRLEWNTAPVSGQVECEATVMWADQATTPVTLRLRGTVRPPFDITPVAAVFLSAYVGEPKSQTLAIAVAGDKPVTITRLEPGGPHFSAALNTTEAGRRYELAVSVAAGAPPGRYREHVTLHTTHPTTPTLVVPVNVLVKADLYANPESVDFGQVSLVELVRQPAKQALITQTFIVRRRQGPFAITAVASDRPWLKVERDPQRGKSEAFRFDVSLDFPRLVPGTKLDGTITISTDDPRFPEIRVPVKGSTR